MLPGHKQCVKRRQQGNSGSEKEKDQLREEVGHEPGFWEEAGFRPVLEHTLSEDSKMTGVFGVGHS